MRAQRTTRSQFGTKGEVYLPIIHPMKSPENRTGKWKILVWHQFLNHISNPKQRFHIVEQISFHFNFRSPQIGRSLETKQNKSHFTLSLSLSPTWGNLPHIRDRNRKYTTKTLHCLKGERLVEEHVHICIMCIARNPSEEKILFTKESRWCQAETGNIN